MAENKIRQALKNISSVPSSILTYDSSQKLTTSEKAQAATNIAAIQYEPQTLSTSQKTQVRENISAGNAETIIVNDVTVATSAWASDTTYSEYPYKANIAVSGMTANHYPSVTMGMTEVLSGNYAPICSSGSGIVTIYAKTAPTAAITISTICGTKVK